ncbi:MAG: HAMP domain-containing sensor histidine kinase [Sulfurovum sp.]
MNKYEKESIFKNFFVFFSLLEILFVLLFLEIYHIKKSDYKYILLQDMRLCSYSLECPKFSFDFVPQEKNIINVLYDKNDTHAYFTIPQSKKYYMKISYHQKSLKQDTKDIKHKLLLQFILASILLFGVALFFTFYSLRPIREALRLNDEFIKDILHDFNTPITAMILNIKMFRDELGENEYITRLKKSIDTLLLLQNNLKSFLDNAPSQNENINITKLTYERVKYIENLYPRLTFVFEKQNDILKFTNKELLTRILDNILSNASKYNSPRGEVKVTIRDNLIVVKDTGKGIKDIDKAFQRYYKEQKRGIGLGLHIVLKFCNELNITIKIESQIDIGTEVRLNLEHLKGE